MRARVGTYVGGVAVLAGLYFGAAKLGLLAALPPGTVTPLWPPIGIALAALLRFGSRLWPGVALGDALASLSLGIPLPVALGMAAANAGAALLGAALLTRVARIDLGLGHLRDIVALVGAAAALSAVAATVGVLSLWLGGLVSGEGFWAAWWTWSLGDVLGALVVAPALLTWFAGPRVDLRAGRLGEASLLVLGLLLGGELAFGESSPALAASRSTLAYLMFPLVGWAALRFGPRGGAAATLAACALTIWSTSHGLGPFAGGSLRESLTQLDAFLGVLATTSLLLAAGTAERRQADEAREAGRLLLQAVVESSGDPVFAKDRHGRYLIINTAAARLWRRTAEECLGRRDTEVFPPEVAREFHETDRRVMERKETLVYENSVEFPDGRHTHLVTKAPLRDREGRVVGVIAIAHDVTERRHLEEQLFQAQKMEAVGRLAGGVAHDFNNLLTAILGYAGLARRRLAADSPVLTDLEEIGRAGNRAATLVSQLLAFSRRQVLQPTLIDLNDVVKGMDDMLRRLIGEHITVTIAAAAPGAAVRADRGRIEQVILNLVINARDALPRGGRIAIETRAADLDQAFVTSRPPLTAGPHVLLLVSDTGIGMDEETRKHLFEPFFTTKGPGHGTGLGLATVYGIVSQSDGHIDVDSRPAQGTTFTIYLPRAAEPSLPPPAVHPLAPLPRGTETVLVTEDEAAVRYLARTVLEESGYTVLDAPNGAAALLVAAAYAGPIDLLVTDVVMPVMGGREAAGRLRALRPETKVLFMSAYSDPAAGPESPLEGGDGFLQKPFSPEELERTVREVLDSSRPHAVSDTPPPAA